MTKVDEAIEWCGECNVIVYGKKYYDTIEKYLKDTPHFKTILQALEDKDNRIKELEEQSDITLNTLFNQKDGTVTLSSERYDSEERQIIRMSNKLDKIKEVLEYEYSGREIGSNVVKLLEILKED